MKSERDELLNRLLNRFVRAVGCDGDDSFEPAIRRVEALYGAVRSTHKNVVCMNGTDTCLDCGADIEDAMAEGALCPGGKKKSQAKPVFWKSIVGLMLAPVIGAVALIILIIWLTDIRKASCYKSPLGGVPVTVHSMNDVLYACAELEGGTFCRRMEECPE